MTGTEDSFDASLNRSARLKPDVDDGETVKFGVFRRTAQPAVRVIDSAGKNWVIPFHWMDIGYEEDGALVIKFANGYTMTVEGKELFEPLHLAVIDYFQRQVMSLFRVGAPAVTSITIEKDEERVL